MVLTVEEVATALRVTTKTVYKLISSGDLLAFRVGSQWRVREADLTKFIESFSSRK